MVLNIHFLQSTRASVVLLATLAFLVLSGTLSGQTSELVYVKSSTRETTRQASLQATRQKLGEFKHSPWQFLGKTATREALKFSSSGEVNLAEDVRGIGGVAMRWQPAALPDAEWGHIGDGTNWLYRTLVSGRETDANFTLGYDALVKVYFNGIDVNSFATTFGMEDRKAQFTVKVKQGVNHVLIWFGAAPSPFFYELSPINANLLAALEERLDKDFPPEGEQRYYRLETVRVPEGMVLEVGGLAMAHDGKRIMVATRRGEIWAYTPGAEKWHRFASGLHEPLGLVPGKPGEFFLLQRPELTRVADTDGDDVADTFQTITAEWGLSGGHHEYIFGPVRDSQGNFWGVISGLADRTKARWSGWCFKVTAAGEFIPWSRGFRSSNGIGVTPDDEVFVAENQGEYVGTSLIHHVNKGAFHGHPIGLLWDKDYGKNPYEVPIEELESMRKLPAILLPYGPMGQSTSQPLVDTTGGKFGPFAGQMFVGDQSKAIVMRVALQKVDGEFQGAAFPFRRGFQSGNNRILFTADGSLYVGQTDRGWGSVGGRPFGLQRVVWTGEAPLEVQTMKLVKGGFELAFTKPVDPVRAANPGNYSLQHYYYPYHAKYGAPQTGNTPVAVAEVKVSADAKTVILVVPGLVTRRIYELNLKNFRARDGTELLHSTAYYTLNRLVR
ncbi:MAG: hypothetical protein AB1705_25355 [Verrucomicrobiota bacterium]